MSIDSSGTAVLFQKEQLTVFAESFPDMRMTGEFAGVIVSVEWDGVLLGTGDMWGIPDGPDDDVFELSPAQYLDTNVVVGMSPCTEAAITAIDVAWQHAKSLANPIRERGGLFLRLMDADEFFDPNRLPAEVES